jgi:RNA polymerase sigma factor (sigma-70 family)
LTRLIWPPVISGHAKLAAALDSLPGTVRDAKLSTALNWLSEREKIVTTLHYLEGLPYQEIGEVFGITETRAMQIQRKALELLRKSLEEQLGI